MARSTIRYIEEINNDKENRTTYLVFYPTKIMEYINKAPKTAIRFMENSPRQDIEHCEFGMCVTYYG